MATIVNNPPQNEKDSGGGFFVGMILVVLFIILFIFYGLPLLQRGGQQSGGTNIQVPEQIDVNVNQNP